MKEEAIAEPEGTANPTERELVERFVAAETEVEQLKNQLKEANDRLEKANDDLLKLLDDDDKKSSAKYEGLGHVTKVDGAAQASIEKGRQEEVLQFLKENGREDMIKTTVAAPTLSTYVRECLKNNDPLPPGVTFYKPRWINFYKA